jgi:hypothetical protein
MSVKLIFTGENGQFGDLKIHLVELNTNRSHIFVSTAKYSKISVFNLKLYVCDVKKSFSVIDSDDFYTTICDLASKYNAIHIQIKILKTPIVFNKIAVANKYSYLTRSIKISNNHPRYGMQINKEIPISRIKYSLKDGRILPGALTYIKQIRSKVNFYICAHDTVIKSVKSESPTDDLYTLNFTFGLPIYLFPKSISIYSEGNETFDVEISHVHKNTGTKSKPTDFFTHEGEIFRVGNNTISKLMSRGSKMIDYDFPEFYPIITIENAKKILFQEYDPYTTAEIILTTKYMKYRALHKSGRPYEPYKPPTHSVTTSQGNLFKSLRNYPQFVQSYNAYINEPLSLKNKCDIVFSIQSNNPFSVHVYNKHKFEAKEVDNNGTYAIEFEHGLYTMGNGHVDCLVSSSIDNQSIKIHGEIWHPEFRRPLNLVVDSAGNSYEFGKVCSVKISQTESGNSK